MNERVKLLAEEMLGLEPQHPLLPLPGVEMVVGLLQSPSGQKELGEVLEFRREAIRRAQADPVRFELEPEYWADVRGAIAEKIKVAIILGGNRSGKSRLCGKLVVEALLHHPGTMILAVAEDETASRETQQKIIWHYLPAEIKARCHNKRDPAGVFYVNYSEANGFSERKLVFPLPDPKEWAKLHPGKPYPTQPSKLLFATYGESPDDYEGLEFGHPQAWTIAWWGDENLRLAWLNMFVRRGRFRPGVGLWSYTPIHGITPTIKEATSGAVTVAHRPARLLQERVNVPGLPKGTMPYIQQPADQTRRVFYFHSEMSPFGPGPNGNGQPYAESVAQDCAGKPSEYVMRIAYGYTCDVIGRAYPKFTSEVHVVPVGRLPHEGTNYCYIDPAGDRNWFMVWVRVPPGSPKRLYFYREWPDARRYGEWAVPTARAVTEDSRKGWDGERGPGQRNQGWGVVRYKQLLLAEETISTELGADGLWVEKDPYRRRRLNEALEQVGLKAKREEVLPWGERVCWWDLDLVAEFRKRHPEPVREVVRIRKVDPRAAANPQASERGGVNILTLFAEEQRKPSGQVEGVRMTLLPAYSGKGIDDGLAHVNELLDYNTEEPVVPVLNEPRLYVSSGCANLRWMFENYTNRGGEEAGCKDPADLVRYAAQDDDVRHVSEGGKLRVGGFREGY